RKVPVEKSDEPVRTGERQLRQEQIGDEFEVCGTGANPNGERDDSDDRETGRLPHHSHPEPQVNGPSREPSESSTLSLMLFYLLDTSECPLRRIARFFRRHAFLDKLIFEELQMCVDLSREFGVGFTCAKECDEP